MSDPAHPGRPSVTAQRGEFESAREWVATGYELEGERNPIYDRLFDPAGLDWTRTSVLDVGAGPVSIFEHVAPASADVTAHDTLAEEYNTLVDGKQFPIVSIIPDRRFDIVALLNCLDHMDAPAELLAHVAPRLAPDGAAWVYCNVDQPYDPALHPQDFRFWQLIALVSGHFDIERCGLTREGRLFPYAWWAICRARRPCGSLRRLRRRWWFTAQCGTQYAWFHTVRVGIKLVKLAGGRALLPEELRF